MTAFIIAQKELKELYKDKRNILLSIIFPLAVAVIMFFVSLIFISNNIGDQRLKVVVNEDASEYVNINSEIYSVEIKKDSEDIRKKMMSGQFKLGLSYDKTNNVLTFIQKEQNMSDPFVLSVKENIKNDIQNKINPASDLLNSMYLDFGISEIESKSEFLSENNDDKFLKIYAIVVAAVGIILSTRLNNSNAYYLSTQEKSSGTFEILMISPVNTYKIILGKWLTNFISCFSMTMIVTMPILILFWIITKVILNLSINLVATFPLTILCYIIFSAIFSLLQLTLGFYANSKKQAQIYLVYTPLAIITPMLVFMGVELKSLSELTSLKFMDFIPVVNFYELIKLAVLSEFNILKVLVIFIINIAVAAVCFLMLIKRFSSDKVLTFMD